MRNETSRDVTCDCTYEAVEQFRWHIGHDLATWTTHETAQRQEVSSCTHWFNGPSVLLAHSSISASKDAHHEGLDLCPPIAQECKAVFAGP